jgi:DNA ligase (NAD+)
LVNNFPDFIKFYEKIKSFLTLEKKKEIKKSKLNGTTIVFSSFRDQDLQKQLEGLGVKIGSSVSKNTDYLVVKDEEAMKEGTSKIEKAKELEVKIITKKELQKMI